jgi:hypothetical protein
MMLRDSYISNRWFRATILTAVVISIALLSFSEWDIIGGYRDYQSDTASGSDSVQSFIKLPSSATPLDSPRLPQDFSAGNSTLGVGQKT